ncbi:LRR receptor-like serine/threonine-protein kinase ERL2 [Platanthera zijinensis]|uniref:LRR receptor-like serine/threonine-protein kinase ERL2 n=1 Tax=Platanthera zijinensis TaxID=2320716 RepID=A0AAP0AVC1_9ASPA
MSPFGNLLFYEYMENGSLWDLLYAFNGQLKMNVDSVVEPGVSECFQSTRKANPRGERVAPIQGIK